MFNFIKRNHLWFILAFGIALYLRQYLANLALYTDEVLVYFDITGLPVSNFLHQPLPFFQAAPFGFLVIEKLFVCLLGTGEQILRFFPFVSGVASLWLFFRMAQIYLKGEFVIFALLTFIFTPTLVCYSSQVKPYSTDVFFVLLSYVVITQCCLKELDWDKTIIMAWLGAIIIWFSFPVIFVLLGIALVFLFDAWAKKDPPKFLMLGFISLYWLLSYILCYKIVLYNFTQVTETPQFLLSWQEGCISLTGNNNWLYVFIKIFNDPVGIPPLSSLLAVVIFLIGGYAFFRADKKSYFFLTYPLLFVLLASMLYKYPCQGRLVLFLVPIFLIIIVKGIETFSLKMGRYKTITAFLLIGILFGHSFLSTTKNLTDPGSLEPYRNSEIRPVIFYFKKHLLPGDILFVCRDSVPTFEYYARRFDFSR